MSEDKPKKRKPDLSKQWKKPPEAEEETGKTAGDISPAHE